MRKNNKGFSLIELIVALTILAIATTVLAPSLIQYVEKTRAKRDDSAMNDVVMAIENALSDPIVLNELTAYSDFGNISCYIDSPSEITYEREILRESEEQGVLQYTFDDNCRILDEVPYYTAGSMRGVTITFTSSGSNGRNTKFDIKDAKVNKYFNDASIQTTLGSLTQTYNAIEAAVSDKVAASSQTYRNSEYTIFVKMTAGGQLIESSEGNIIEVYGQWGGTNLPTGIETHVMAEDRVVKEEVFTTPDADFDSTQNSVGDEIIVVPPVIEVPGEGGGTSYTQYRIDYYPGIEIGCDPPTGNPTQYDITTPEFTLQNPTREGYEFLGWTGSNGEYPTTVVTISPGTTGHKSYYANEERHWALKNYSITYNLGGGTNAPQNPIKYTIKDGDIVLQSPSYAGAVFLGWTGSNGSAPQKNVIIPAGSKGDKTYTANWEWYQYPIVYDLNDIDDGLDNAITNDNPTRYTLVTSTITLKDPVKKGYTFLGWTGSNGSTPQKGVQIAKGSTGTKTYTANWEANVYYVDFNHMVNGTLRTSAQIGTADIYINGVQVANDVYDYYKQHPQGTKWAIMDIKPYPGYKYNDEMVYEGVVNGKAMSANVHWLSIIYKISLDANGGTCSETLREIPYEYTYQGKPLSGGGFEYGDLPTPTRSGYTFNGWFTDPVAGTQVLSTDLIGTSDIVLHAHWTKN